MSAALIDLDEHICDYIAHWIQRLVHSLGVAGAIYVSHLRSVVHGVEALFRSESFDAHLKRKR